MLDWIGESGVVLLPMTSSFKGARVIGVPETVIFIPPAIREAPSIARPERVGSKSCVVECEIGRCKSRLVGRRQCDCATIDNESVR